MTDGSAWPPGWFPDPTGRHDHRWWDGAAWTAHVADAGIASTDPLPEPGPGPAPGRPAPPRPAQGPSDGMSVAALAVAIGSLVLAFVPGFGLVLPVAAIVLAVLGRSRIRRSGGSGDGIAIAGLVTGIVGLVLALVVTAFTALLLLTFQDSGGDLALAVTQYITCLETGTAVECQAAFEESLARITE